MPNQGPFRVSLCTHSPQYSDRSETVDNDRSIQALIKQDVIARSFACIYFSSPPEYYHYCCENPFGT